MNADLKFYWKLILRRMPAMMALFLLCAGLAVALAFKLPTTYSTTSRMLVEAPQISDVGGTVNTGAAEQLEIIQQRLMTRANLIDIANNRRVFGDTSTMSPDAIVDAMRRNTTISRSSGRNRATLMSVSFSASTGQIAAAVVNDYVTLILEENVRLRTGRAEGTVSFFEQEVERLNRELSAQSASILSFKTANAEALPDSLNYRRSRQDMLQERVARDERAIEGLQDQRSRIIAIYESTGRLQPPSEAQLSPEERRLQSLQNELSSALTVYSETNPRVRVLKNQIAQLESQIAASSGQTSGAGETVSQQTLFEITLAQIDSQIAQLNEDIDKTSIELDRLEESIAATASNQIALDALERDYANLRNQYNASVMRRNEAAMGERIELSAKGQRITVIERATVPDRPSSPNRPLIAAAGIGMGLAAAGGLFLLLEFLNKSVRRPSEIVRSLGIAPLVTIPYMETRSHKWMRRSLQVTSFLVVLAGVPAGLWAIDTYYMPLDLLVERLITRLGLA